eukprot:CAMPEP_0170516470 /NCGR_PEP_ID=MMETSP0209-20121228/2667_1 /TAXON_ID=665100 ORGANISM="Litonotus pictus, Strain P1" /NCGR_SAMPLE_ID=MMETSP0209 /ASSEMBLY_ACC=CAM_ASM_000301 /LENGTH=952 /DNA_ID=CAMNT_0010801359 /DNA_START=54 /DNA_END=2912 /DNA_ORIENTATION=-
MGSPKIKELLDNNCSLEELLDEEELIQELKSSNAKLIDYFSFEQITKLLDYMIKEPVEDDHKTGHKYPFIACEVLNCNVERLSEMFFYNHRQQKIYDEERLKREKENKEEVEPKELERKSSNSDDINSADIAVILENSNDSQKKEEEEEHFIPVEEENSSKESQERKETPNENGFVEIESENDNSSKPSALEEEEELNKAQLIEKQETEAVQPLESFDSNKYELLEYFFSFVRVPYTPEKELNDVLSGYFLRFFKTLFDRSPQKMVSYISDVSPEITDGLLLHSYSYSIADTISLVLDTGYFLDEDIKYGQREMFVLSSFLKRTFDYVCELEPENLLHRNSLYNVISNRLLKSKSTRLYILKNKEYLYKIVGNCFLGLKERTSEESVSGIEVNAEDYRRYKSLRTESLIMVNSLLEETREVEEENEGKIALQEAIEEFTLKLIPMFVHLFKYRQSKQNQVSKTNKVNNVDNQEEATNIESEVIESADTKQELELSVPSTMNNCAIIPLGEEKGELIKFFNHIILTFRKTTICTLKDSITEVISQAIEYIIDYPFNNLFHISALDFFSNLTSLVKQKENKPSDMLANINSITGEEATQDIGSQDKEQDKKEYFAEFDSIFEHFKRSVLSFIYSKLDTKVTFNSTQNGINQLYYSILVKIGLLLDPPKEDKKDIGKDILEEFNKQLETAQTESDDNNKGNTDNTGELGQSSHNEVTNDEESKRNSNQEAKSEVNIIENFIKTDNNNTDNTEPSVTIGENKNQGDEGKDVLDSLFENEDNSLQSKVVKTQSSNDIVNVASSPKAESKPLSEEEQWKEVYYKLLKVKNKFEAKLLHEETRKNSWGFDNSKEWAEIPQISSSVKDDFEANFNNDKVEEGHKGEEQRDINIGEELEFIEAKAIEHNAEKTNNMKEPDSNQKPDKSAELDWLNEILQKENQKPKEQEFEADFNDFEFDS